MDEWEFQDKLKNPLRFLFEFDMIQSGWTGKSVKAVNRKTGITLIPVGNEMNSHARMDICFILSGKRGEGI